MGLRYLPGFIRDIKVEIQEARALSETRAAPVRSIGDKQLFSPGEVFWSGWHAIEIPSSKLDTHDLQSPLFLNQHLSSTEYTSFMYVLSLTTCPPTSTQA